MATHGTLPSGWALLVTLLLLPLTLSVGEAQLQCPPDAGFKNGLTHLTDGLNVGSIANFLCPSGQYAWPVRSRTCQANGQWSAMRSSTGRRRTSVLCKSMHCPRPVEFDNGEYYPRGSYVVGNNITFTCNDGYIPRGSMERTCQRNAKWSGETAICDSGAGHCPDPGVPPGAIKTGDRYDIGESVSYSCHNDLVLMGSAKRTCLESRRWSGTEVNCQYPFSFDLPEDAGRQFTGSLAGVLKTSEKKESAGRSVKIKKDGILNVYILLDASKSVGEDNFTIAKECAEILVQTIGKFDMKIEFGIMSYATDTNVTVLINNDDASELDDVLESIQNNLKYSNHKDKSGTNIKGALNKVLDMMALQRERHKKDWNSIQHVIILLTDGKSNMGGRPVDAVARIHEFLNISRGREDYLDIYAFGIGNDPDKSELNDIASKKADEQHVFNLENADRLKDVFKKILNITKYGDMCGITDESSPEGMYPWNVFISTRTTNPCLGSLISKQWVLTAAHCFNPKIPQNSYDFTIGGTDYKGERIEIHKCYDLRRKLERFRIEEDYDYDVALVKLEKKVTFSELASPICIPCTEPANRAMKKPMSATCEDHEQHLLASMDIPAGFLAKNGNLKRMDEIEEKTVTIKHNAGRGACISSINKWLQPKKISPDQLVSDRHFCVEGDMSCKGESGGSVFVDLRQRKRFFQVGIVSFGIFNPCETKGQRKENSSARDFYINVMEVLPFIHKHLAEELTFLPGIPSHDEVVCPT